MNVVLLTVATVTTSNVVVLPVRTTLSPAVRLEKLVPDPVIELLPAEKLTERSVDKEVVSSYPLMILIG